MDFFSSVLAKSMCGGGGGAGNDVRALMITKTAPGTPDTAEVNDAANCRLQGVRLELPEMAPDTDIVVYGKNMLVPSDSTVRTQNGVTYYFDAEAGEFVLNGTVNAAGDIKLVPVLQLDWMPYAKYTFTARHTGGTVKIAENTGGYNTTYGFGIFQSDAAKYIRGQLGNATFVPEYKFTGDSFALDDKKHYILYLQCWRIGTVFDNCRIKIQLEKGTEATEWEYPTRQIAPVADVSSIVMQRGYNFVRIDPVQPFVVEYAVDPKTYIDNKIAGVE